jgi:peptidyl-prolyl cis-trans isomerase SurA
LVLLSAWPRRARNGARAGGSHCKRLPITEYDIQQRTAGGHFPKHNRHRSSWPDRRSAQIARAKVYGLEIGDAEVNNAFDSMASRQHITTAQFSQVLERAGISPNTVKARIRAELTWQQLIRGKYAASLQVGESDIAKALKERSEGDAPAVGYIYTLYPVMIVVARGSNEATLAAKRSEAENLVVGSSPAMRGWPWRADCAMWRCVIR